MWKLMLMAGLGGFVGTCCRYLINRTFLVIWRAPFPLATFTINVIGCFLFGLIMAILSKNGMISSRLNALLITGFCGGFTTFSTFSFETFTLAGNGEISTSLFYVIASVVAGFLAVWLGMFIAR